MEIWIRYCTVSTGVFLCHILGFYLMSINKFMASLGTYIERIHFQVNMQGVLGQSTVFCVVQYNAKKKMKILYYYNH